VLRCSPRNSERRAVVPGSGLGVAMVFFSVGYLFLCRDPLPESDEPGLAALKIGDFHS